MRVKWGVVGSGGIAKRRTIPEGIVPAANAELVAVYDQDGGANAAVAEDYGVTACGSFEALLETDCGAVYIATPVDAHCGQTLQAAAAGKHVLCEKPLGLTVDEAERMVRACADAGVKLGVGLMMRFHAYHREMQRLIAAGRLGVPVFARAQLSCWYPPIEGAWRQNPARGGGGSLVDMGSHCMDVLEMLLGKVRRVACFTSNLVHSYESEDTAAVLLEFESGAKGCVDTLFNVPDESVKNRLEVYGSTGSILAEGTIGQGEAGIMQGYFQQGAADYDAQQARTTGGFTELAPEPVNMYRAEIEAFSQALLDDGQPPVDGNAGLWNQRLLEACYESARTGSAVELA